MTESEKILQTEFSEEFYNISVLGFKVAEAIEPNIVRKVEDSMEEGLM